MTKNERNQVKDRFKSFNDNFEEFHKLQRKFSVPDPELRSQLIKDIRNLIVPMYSRFLQRYQSIEFSTHREKYIKYEATVVDRMIGEFYATS